MHNESRNYELRRPELVYVSAMSRRGVSTWMRRTVCVARNRQLMGMSDGLLYSEQPILLTNKAGYIKSFTLFEQAKPEVDGKRSVVASQTHPLHIMDE